jgi:hypothetical protein
MRLKVKTSRRMRCSSASMTPSRPERSSSARSSLTLSRGEPAERIDDHGLDEQPQREDQAVQHEQDRRDDADALDAAGVPDHLREHLAEQHDGEQRAEGDGGLAGRRGPAQQQDRADDEVEGVDRHVAQHQRDQQHALVGEQRLHCAGGQRPAAPEVQPVGRAHAEQGGLGA